MRIKGGKINKDMIVACGVLLACAVIIVMVLYFRKVGVKRNQYYFVRVYPADIPQVSLVRVKTFNVLAHMPSTPTEIGSIRLRHGGHLSFDCSAESSSYSFYLAGERKEQSGVVVKRMPADRYENKAEEKLAYFGHFVNCGSYITFTFSHLPLVYIFSESGQFIRTVKTKDGVPYPVIVRYKDYYLYKQGETFDSNIVSFAGDGVVYVFSYRVPKGIDQLIVDLYRMDTGEYMGSRLIADTEGCNNSEIKALEGVGGKLYMRVADKVYQVKVNEKG